MNLYDIAVARKLSSGGGGGSSDFYQATITFVNNLETTSHLSVFLKDFTVNSDYYTGYYIDSEAGVTSEISDDLTATPGDSASIQVNVLNGKAISADYYESETAVLSGDAEFVEVDGYTYIRITGDCTITINY